MVFRAQGFRPLCLGCIKSPAYGILIMLPTCIKLNEEGSSNWCLNFASHCNRDYPWYIELTKSPAYGIFTPPLHLVYWTPSQWYCQTPIHGIANPLFMECWHPSNCISNPLPIVCWTYIHGVMDFLHMYIVHPTHGILTPLRMVYRTPSYRILNPLVLVEMGCSIYHDGVQNTKYKDENLNRGQNTIWYHDGVA